MTQIIANAGQGQNNVELTQEHIADVEMTRVYQQERIKASGDMPIYADLANRWLYGPYELFVMNLRLDPQNPSNFEPNFLAATMATNPGKYQETARQLTEIQREMDQMSKWEKVIHQVLQNTYSLPSIF